MFPPPDHGGGCRMEWLYARGIPIEAQFLYRKALDLSKRGDDESALKYLMQAVVIAPKYARAFFEMGNCLARLGRSVKPGRNMTGQPILIPAF